jgi:hypothetical protein
MLLHNRTQTQLPIRLPCFKHAASVHPLSQDETLHEIHSCITYNSLVDKHDSDKPYSIVRTKLFCFLT